MRTTLQIGGLDFPVQPMLAGMGIVLLFGLLPFLQPFSILGMGLILGTGIAMFWAFRGVDQPFSYTEAFAIGSITAFGGDLVLLLLKVGMAVGQTQVDARTMLGGFLYLLSAEVAKCLLIGGGTSMIIASVERRRWRRKD